MFQSLFGQKLFFSYHLTNGFLGISRVKLLYVSPYRANLVLLFVKAVKVSFMASRECGRLSLEPLNASI